MFSKRFTHNDDVVDVDEAAAFNQTTENTFHKSLKGHRGICLPEWHDLELIVPIMGDKEGSLFLRGRFYSDLPVAHCQVKCGEVLRLGKQVQRIVYPR